MHKIGIITIHKSQNYGGSLQAYALFHYIESLGYHCEVIDLFRPAIKGYVYSPQYPSLIEQQKGKKSFLNKLNRLIEKNKDKRFKKEYSEKILLKQKRFESFFSMTSYSKPYNSISSLYAIPPQYDVFVTGSDQVWNPTIGFNIEPYFLTFALNGKKVSYASSIGLSKLPDNLKDYYKNWLSKYDNISVREYQAKTIINDLLPTVEVEEVCDPTLLISSEEWIKASVTPIKKNYVLCFSLSYNCKLYEYAEKIAKKENKQLVIFSHGYKDENVKYAEKVYDAGPLEWIGWINNADIVITDSFHATLFSIQCRKKFQVYIDATNKRGSRIINILAKVGLEKHIVRDFYKLTEIPEIDYENVWCKLEGFINHSKQYLIHALK